MKKEQKENVNITTIAFRTEHTGKENMFFSFVVPFLCLFFAVTGLVGCFVTAFSLQVVPFLLYFAIFLLCLFWTFFSRLKLEGIYRFLAFIAVMVVASILLLLLQGQAIAGFFQVANGIFENLNESYHGNIALYQVSENGMYATIFLLFLMVPVSGLLSFSIVKRQNIWTLAAVAFPVVFSSCLTMGNPKAFYLFLLFFSILGLLAQSVLVMPYSFEGMEQAKAVREERFYQEIKSKVLIGISIPIIILSVLAFLTLRPVLNYPITQVRDAGSKTENGVLQIIWHILPGISGGNLELQLEGVGGGVDEGALGRTEGFSFGSVQALKVTCDTKPDETIYLKGYVGSTYTGTSFDAESGITLANAAFNWKTDGDALLYIQNLSFLRMMYAENMIISNEEEDTPQLSEELTSSAVEMQVENLNANESYTYVPYYAYLNDYYEMLAGDGAVASQNRADDIFSYYPRSVYEEKMTEWQEMEDAHGILDNVEKSYEGFVKSTYLQVPEEGLEQLKEECEAVELEDIEEIKEYVVNTLNENTSFNMDVETLPEGKDFVSWFLYEKKEGYATHYAAAATMMFRMLGVPARYVVGYVAPEGIFTMQSDGSYMAILEDDNAHAWTEIYVSGVGWVPVETTPGYVAMVAEGSGDAQGEELTGQTEAETGETESVQENEVKEVIVEKKEQDFRWVMPVLIVFGCFGGVVVVAVVRRNYLLKKRAGKQSKLEIEDNIKNLYHSFRSLLVFDGWNEAPGCEAEDFASQFAEKYPVCSEEDYETFANVVLKTYYGYDRRKKKELHFLFTTYRRVGKKIYKQLSFGRRMQFKWWKCYL